MASLKRFQVLLVVGSILLLGSIWFFIYPSLNVDSRPQTQTGTIPSGNQLVLRFKFDNLPYGTQLSGQFSELSGGLVNFYVFDASQYQMYLTQGQAQSLFSTSGGSGSFSASIPQTGTYYIVLTHGGSIQAAQQVSLTYQVTGVDITSLTIGLVVLVAGSAFAVVGWREKKRIDAKTPRESGIVLFEKVDS